MYKYLVVIIVHLVTSQVLAAESPTALELINKYQAIRKAYQSLSTKSTNKIEVNDTETGRTLHYQTSQFQSDGQKIDFKSYQWYDVKSLNQTMPAEDAYTRNFIWNNKQFYEFQKSETSDGLLYISSHDGMKKGQISVVYSGAPLIGVFNSDYEPVDHILGKSDTLSVREELELVGQSNCYVIDAVTPSGHYTLWIDPEHGYNISKAEVSKKVNDIAWGAPLKRDTKKLEGLIYVGQWPGSVYKVGFSLKNVQFQKINGIWVPTEADFEHSVTHSNERTSIIKTHHERTHVELEPDFEKTGAFVPDIPDGARVFIEEAPGIEYEWRGNKPVTKIDQSFLDVLETSTDELVSDAELVPEVKVVKEMESVAETNSLGNVIKTQKNSPVTKSKLSFGITITILFGLLAIIISGLLIINKCRKSSNAKD